MRPAAGRSASSGGALPSNSSPKPFERAAAPKTVAIIGRRRSASMRITLRARRRHREREVHGGHRLGLAGNRAGDEDPSREAALRAGAGQRCPQRPVGLPDMGRQLAAMGQVARGGRGANSGHAGQDRQAVPQQQLVLAVDPRVEDLEREGGARADEQRDQERHRDAQHRARPRGRRRRDRGAREVQGRVVAARERGQLRQLGLEIGGGRASPAGPGTGRRAARAGA